MERRYQCEGCGRTITMEESLFEPDNDCSKCGGCFYEIEETTKKKESEDEDDEESDYSFGTPRLQGFRFEQPKFGWK